MYLFSFLLFPAVLVYRCISIYKSDNGKQELKNKLLVMLAGAASGLIICSIYEFFFFISDYNGLNLAVYSIVKWLVIIFVPALFYVFYILWSKDSWQIRIENFQYFMLPLLCFYIPYMVFTDSFDTSSFILFLFPVLYLMLVLSLRVETARFYDALINKKTTVFLYGVLIVVESMVPVFIEGLWHFDYFALIWIAIAVLFCIFCAFRGKVEVKSILEAFENK